jgi:hypothetical protein
MTEARGQKTEVRRWITEDGRQRTENRIQRPEDRGRSQRLEDRTGILLTPDLQHITRKPKTVTPNSESLNLDFKKEDL